MNHLNLLSKVFYLNTKSLNNIEYLEDFSKYQSKLITNSIDSLPSATMKLLKLKNPGTHDYFLKLGEAYCILIECQEASIVSNKIKELINVSTESLTYILKGVVIYYKRFLGLNDLLDVDCDRVPREATKNRLYNQLMIIFKQKIYESIINASQIDNRLNLKTVGFNLSKFFNYLFILKPLKK